ncbi:MAG TPA: glycoside hydrolase family 99-like domain-containing protein [Methylomirabilota bacterium]|jgi:lipopolysaccharide biosynthesis protein
MTPPPRTAEVTNPLRVIAFYLPQFHPIPENDAWWGSGFTEWTMVAAARPLFRGHEQPHLPADLGFYDLRVPEVREAQAELARTHGLAGFCYYHYWFSGTRLLHRPFDEVLRLKTPDLPFCLCWANENWTRAWNGGDHDILMAQTYSRDDDVAHIEHVFPAFEDDRYIKIGGKPLFLVYRSEMVPDAARTAELWRRRAREAGVGELYLARVEGFRSDLDPRTIGFDAAVEFAPAWRLMPTARGTALPSIARRLRHIGRPRGVRPVPDVYPYRRLVDVMLAAPPPRYPRFRCVTPSWDNSPRRGPRATIFHGSTPAQYEAWLTTVAAESLATRSGDERIVFINAWNEWGEGSHLEPDQRWGRAYLHATRRAIEVASRQSRATGPPPAAPPSPPR